MYSLRLTNFKLLPTSANLRLMSGRYKKLPNGLTGKVLRKNSGALPNFEKSLSLVRNLVQAKIR